MDIKNKLNYELETLENINIEDILKLHQNCVNIFIHGSGASPDETTRASFFALMEYNGKMQPVSTTLHSETANQASLEGLRICINSVCEQMHVCIITAASLGFESAFKNKGVNAKRIQEIYEILLEKECTLTEVRCNGMARIITNFIYKNSTSNELLDKQNAKTKRKKHYVSSYGEKVYNQCISDVISILESYKVNDEAISKIKELKFSI